MVLKQVRDATIVWVNLMEEVLWHGGMWKRYVSIPPTKCGFLLAIAGLIQHFFLLLNRCFHFDSRHFHSNLFQSCRFFVTVIGANVSYLLNLEIVHRLSFEVFDRCPIYCRKSYDIQYKNVV